MANDHARRLDDVSLEITVRGKRSVATCREYFGPGTNVYITHIPGDELGSIVETATQLRAGGLVPVPHLAARSLESSDQLDDFLGRLAGEAGVDRVLLIGGGIDTPLGPYESSLEVMQSDLLAAHGIVKVGFAVHPEGHPIVSDGDMAEALRAKLALGADQGMETWLVSQFCFTPAPIIACLEALRAAAITAPLRVGLAGPSDRRTLMKYALLCGIGNSIKALGSQLDTVRKLAAIRTPDDIVGNLASAALANPGLGIEGLHVFPFGNIAATAEWRDRMFAGEDASA